ncbi:MAG TPA: carbohydrate porin [Planktothrix sp.]|jgi:hypothetical protein
MTFTSLNVRGRDKRGHRLRWILFIPVFLALSTPVFAQSTTSADNQPPCPPDNNSCPSTQAEAQVQDSPGPSSGDFNMFDHSQPSRFWISGQVNVIDQWHPSFHSPYSGQNSFTAPAENAMSRLSTLFLGYRLTQWTDVFFAGEEFNGGGLSKTYGLASFTDMDVVRNPSLGPKPYVARFGIHTIIPLSDKLVDNDRTWSDPESQLPEKRIEIRVGKFSAPDFMDPNSASSDSHHQFMNWGLDNELTWDYPADTRGYTYGAEIEYDSPHFSARFLEGLMPYVANGLQLDWNLARSHSESLELEFRPQLFQEKSTVIRFLGFVNHANMGDYAEAIKMWQEGLTPVPDVTQTRQFGTVKYGFGVNLEQEVYRGVTVFSRIGWNEGQHESFTYTDVNNTISAGVMVSGRYWGRPTDKFGVAAISDGLSKEHAQYFADGGMGFVVGDGALNYGRENILETFYTAHLWKGVYAGPDVQFVQNPGYNRDRGPVPVLGFRFHVDF